MSRFSGAAITAAIPEWNNDYNLGGELGTTPRF